MVQVKLVNWKILTTSQGKLIKKTWKNTRNKEYKSLKLSVVGFYACNNLPVVHPCQKMSEGPGKTSSTLVVTKTIAEKLGDLI